MRLSLVLSAVMVGVALGGCTRENGLAFDPKSDNQHTPAAVGSAARAIYGDNLPATNPARVDSNGAGLQGPTNSSQ